MTFVCSVCGEEHDDLPALVFLDPDHWSMLSPEQQADGEITEDWCLTSDGHYFVRCSLEIPINDGPQESLSYGVWCSLSEPNFKRYVLAFNDTDQSKLGSMFGWLSNEIPGQFSNSGLLKCNVHPQDDRMRPLVELQPTDHPLAVAQREGISFERAQRLMHSHMKRWIPRNDA
jgi:hypothetical protein